MVCVYSQIYCECLISNAPSYMQCDLIWIYMGRELEKLNRQSSKFR